MVNKHAIEFPRYERWDSPNFYKPAEDKWKISQEEKAKNELAEKKRDELRQIYEQEKQEFYRKLNGGFGFNLNKIRGMRRIE